MSLKRAQDDSFVKNYFSTIRFRFLGFLDVKIVTVDDLTCHYDCMTHRNKIEETEIWKNLKLKLINLDCMYAFVLKKHRTYVLKTQFSNPGIQPTRTEGG